MPHCKMSWKGANISMYRHSLLHSVYNDCMAMRRPPTTQFSKEDNFDGYESESCNGRFSANALRSSSICVALVMRCAMYS